jgi:parallel beta-helix repeat protein
MKQPKKQFHIAQALRKQRAVSALVIIGITSLGVALLMSSHAASPYLATEAESGMLSGIAARGSASAASAGSYISLGQTVTPPTGTAGLGTPEPCPAGSVAVSPGNVPSFQANKNYCFANGTYSGFSAQILTGDGFYGQGKAVLNGNNNVEQAIYTAAPSYAITPPTILNVTIDGFVVENYADPTGSSDPTPPGAINLYGINTLTLSNNSVGSVSEVGIQIGGYQCCAYNQDVYGTGLTNGTITHNRVQNTGFSGLSVNGASNVSVTYNEVSGANTWNANKEESVAGLGKFDSDTGVTVSNNNVHDNNSHGIWFDVYDSNNTIENNQVGPNNIAGIFYEISYNAVISGNTIIDNGAQDANDGIAAPGAGIRISSSGAGSGYPGPQSITVSNNTLSGNHEGITMWDGHGTDLPVNHVHVTGNTTTGDTTAAGTDSDAWLIYTQETGQGNSWSNNSYIANPAKIIFSDPGNTNFAGWKAAGMDTSGSTCKTTSGGSC